MPLTFNVRHLELKNLFLSGELSAQELELDTVDELVRPLGPVAYDLEIEKQERGILVQGSLRLELECECVRCLKKTSYALELEDWSVLLELEGPEPTPVHNDIVDLTPALREDILLSFPQHPLCDPECRGLLSAPPAGVKSVSSNGPGASEVSAWAALDKLKL